MAQIKFEAALSRLEETVKSLETGELSLEASMKVFEEGVRLSKTCMKTLSEAEKKVEFLIEGKGRKKELPESDVSSHEKKGKSIDGA